VQVDAKLPDAPVRFSIWLQAAGSELSVFDIDVKGGNGSYATTFNTGAHTFDSSTTLASAMETVVVEGGAAELAANFHVYGVAWCVADRSFKFSFLCRTFCPSTSPVYGCSSVGTTPLTSNRVWHSAQR
jgi:hypothetical protein